MLHDHQVIRVFSIWFFHTNGCIHVQLVTLDVLTGITTSNGNKNLFIAIKTTWNTQPLTCKPIFWYVVNNAPSLWHYDKLKMSEINSFSTTV